MFSPSRVDAEPEFAAWVEEQEKRQALYLSAVSIHEIEKGVRLLEAKGAKARLIGIFMEGLIAGYGDRILSIDAAVAREAGRLEAKAIMAGHSPGAMDAIIAGTASLHGLTVITRNLRHFLPFDIPVRSPSEPAG